MLRIYLKCIVPIAVKDLVVLYILTVVELYHTSILRQLLQSMPMMHVPRTINQLQNRKNTMKFCIKKFPGLMAGFSTLTANAHLKLGIFLKKFLYRSIDRLRSRRRGPTIHDVAILINQELLKVPL